MYLNKEKVLCNVKKIYRNVRVDNGDDQSSETVSLTVSSDHSPTESLEAEEKGDEARWCSQAASTWSWVHSAAHVSRRIQTNQGVLERVTGGEGGGGKARCCKDVIGAVKFGLWNKCLLTKI